MFRTDHLSIIRSFSLYTRNVLILLTSCQQTCMICTIAVCTVKNCWWWTEELSETCRVLFQNKFEKLVHLVGFIIRIYQDARSPEHKKKGLFKAIWMQLKKYFCCFGQYKRKPKFWYIFNYLIITTLNSVTVDPMDLDLS